MDNKKNNKSEEVGSLDDLVNLEAVLGKSSENKLQNIKIKSNWYKVSEDFDYWGGINLCTTFFY